MAKMPFKAAMKKFEDSPADMKMDKAGAKKLMVGAKKGGKKAPPFAKKGMK